MSALIKAFLTAALLALIAGPGFASGLNNFQLHTVTCLSASDTTETNLDENGNPIVSPDDEEDDEEEDEEPDCE